MKDAPEGIMIFAATAGYQLMKGWHQRKGLLLKSNLIYLIGFLAIFAPYFLWRWGYYGTFLPNTFYAKVGSGIWQYIRGINYVRHFILDHGGIVFALALFPFLWRKSPFWINYFALINFIYIGYIIWVGGDSLPFYRFLVPVLPPLYILVQEGFKDLYYLVCTKDFSGRKGQIIYAAFLLVALLVTFGRPLGGMQKNFVIGDIDNVKKFVLAGKWLRDNALPHESVAANPSGAIAYYSGLYSIDMLGLNDFHIAHRKMANMGKGTAGHEKGDGRYVLSKRPTYILLGNVWYRDKRIEEVALERYLAYTSERELWALREFHLLYQPVSIRVGGRYLGFYKLIEK